MSSQPSGTLTPPKAPTKGATYAAPMPGDVTRGEPIRRMFAAIAERYDLANSVLSVGMHHVWKKKLVRACDHILGARVLDCASGTGDVAFELEKAVGNGGEVTGSDFCAEMLQVAKRRAKESGSHVQFEEADLLALPYASSIFDAVTVSFGIRNVNRPEVALTEMARVTRAGGKVVVMEFGSPHVWLWKSIYLFYSRRILPTIGGVVTGRADAYRYLEASSLIFPSGADFVAMARRTGKFRTVDAQSLMGGVAWIYKMEVGT